MSDIFREIEEDLQRDRLAELWKKYGSLVIVAAVAVVIGTGGWQGWKAYKANRDQAFGKRYADALQMLAQGKSAEAQQSFARLAQDAGAGYAALARLQEAALLIKAGKTDDAVALYNKLASDSGIERPYRELAILLAVYNGIDKGDPAQLSQRLDPLTLASSPWRNSAIELQALLAQRAGDKAKARELFGRIADDATAPSDMRARAAEMIAALKE